MTEKLALPTVEVSVALIARGEHLLAVYNSAWGAFTLPLQTTDDTDGDG